MPETAKAAVEPERREPRRARGRPKAEDVAELEARLIRSARRCFIENGYGATSMNAVARAARVSKGTLYARFPCKADLFRAIIDEQIQKTAAARPAAPTPRSLAAALRAFAEHALEDSLSNEIVQLNRLIYSEAGRFPELGDAAWTRTRFGVQVVAGLIRDFAERDGVGCRDADVPAGIFTTLLRGFYGDVMLRSEPMTEAEIRDWTGRTVDAFLAGRSGW
jgi:AcrR family transcriptional regulator